MRHAEIDSLTEQGKNHNYYGLMTKVNPENAEAKYARISTVVGSLLDGTYSTDTSGTIKISDLQADLANVFTSSVKSYRELVFLVTIARIDDGNFQATKSLYDCNPRALYEKAIRPQFLSRKIVCGQSPALNIAKATEKIGPEWLAQRREKDVAQAVLRLVQIIEGVAGPDLAVIASEMARMFVGLASSIESHKYEGSSITELQSLSVLVRQLITRVPDGGNTAQRIVGLALQSLHSESSNSVDGVEDSASATNATSKKPGDIAISDENGRVLMVFEVTTKTFGEQRIAECSQSLDSYLSGSSEVVDSVTVLCLPENVPAEIRGDSSGGPVVIGSRNDGVFNYEFVELLSWIDAIIASMPASGRQLFFSSLTSYINHFQTSAAVRLEFVRHIATNAEISKT